MFHKVRSGLVLAVAAVVFTLLAGVAQAAAPASAIGVIDLEQVAQGYKGYRVASERITAFEKVREQAFTTLQAGVGLNEKDFAEYRDLTKGGLVVNPKRVDELKELAKKNNAELTALKAKEAEKLTADEQKRLDELKKNAEDGNKVLNEAYTSLMGEVQGEYQRYTSKLTELVDKGIGKVAEGKKLGIVVSKDVRVQQGTEKFVLWGGTDITNDVVDALNKAFNEKLLDATEKK
jgi:Skp family chaperone for outer membrane proteins